jgi:uncharacterized protein YbaR (Trm112 family)
MELDQELFDYLLEVIICPVCKAKVVARPDHTALDCQGCKRVYPMRNGIPIMLKEQATFES